MKELTVEEKLERTMLLEQRIQKVYNKMSRRKVKYSVIKTIYIPVIEVSIVNYFMGCRGITLLLSVILAVVIIILVEIPIFSWIYKNF